MIKTVYFDNNAVVILDQNQLPGKLIYERCEKHEEVAEAIRLLKVRGAPLIGVTAAYGLALAVRNYNGSMQDIETYYQQCEQIFAATRPTAVNLFWAIRKMRNLFDSKKEREFTELQTSMMKMAEDMFEEDVAINRAIGDYGQEILKSSARVMTICNAGALATCGYGTALGVIRSAYEKGKIEQVWACETRPVLQGARLTIWELMEDKIPVTLITDNMAAAVMNLKEISAVVVGADRIAANGDSANKIGSYSLAVLAKYHDIPFYVAAPVSTIDISISCGADIPIEERDKDEVRKVMGNYITVPEVDVYNPAFDVIPHELISGIITEKGIITAPYDEGLRKLF